MHFYKGLLSFHMHFYKGLFPFRVHFCKGLLSFRMHFCKGVLHKKARKRSYKRASVPGSSSFARYLAPAGFFLSGTAWKGWGGVPVKRGLMEAMLSLVISKVNSPPLAASLASRI